MQRFRWSTFYKEHDRNINRFILYISLLSSMAIIFNMGYDTQVFDSFKISDKYSIVETVVPEEFVGATLGEADLTNKYKVLVLTTIQSVTKLESQKEISFKTVTGIAKSTTLLNRDDVLVLFGEIKDINKMIN